MSTKSSLFHLALAVLIGVGAGYAASKFRSDYVQTKGNDNFINNLLSNIDMDKQKIDFCKKHGDLIKNEISAMLDVKYHEERRKKERQTKKAGVKKITKKEYMELKPELSDILAEFRRLKCFVDAEWVKKRCQEILDDYARIGSHYAFVNVSGGVDSALTLALLQLAQSMAPEDHSLHKKNGGRVIGIAQPIDSTPEIQNRAYEVCEALGVECITVDGTKIHELMCHTIETALETIGLNLTDWSRSMLKSYLRTPVIYAIASALGGLVFSTGNMDEDEYLGYFCKYGDGAGDKTIIYDLHKSEVFRLAKFLGVPESIIIAPPSADLAGSGENQTDQNEMGFTYDLVELLFYVRNSPLYKDIDGKFDKNLFINTLKTEEAKEQFRKESSLAEAIHFRNSHKADINPDPLGKKTVRQLFEEEKAKTSKLEAQVKALNAEVERLINAQKSRPDR